MRGAILTDCQVAHEAARKQTIVCSVRNAQTATLVHRMKDDGSKENDYSSMKLLSGQSTETSYDDENQSNFSQIREVREPGQVTFCCECPYGQVGQVEDAQGQGVAIHLHGNAYTFSSPKPPAPVAPPAPPQYNPVSGMVTNYPDIDPEVIRTDMPQTGDNVVQSGDSGADEQFDQVPGEPKGFCSCNATLRTAIYIPGRGATTDQPPCQQCTTAETLRRAKNSYSSEPIAKNNSFTGTLSNKRTS